jgi:hypothetical protein
VKPEITTRKGSKGCVAHFDREACLACQDRSRRPADVLKTVVSLRHTFVSMDAAQRRAANGTPERWKMRRRRSGIEALFSLLKRVCGIRRLRARGLKNVAAALRSRLLGLNIDRARACMQALAKSRNKAA